MRLSASRRTAGAGVRRPVDDGWAGRVGDVPPRPVQAAAREQPQAGQSPAVSDLPSATELLLAHVADCVAAGEVVGDAPFADQVHSLEGAEASRFAAESLAVSDICGMTTTLRLSSSDTSGRVRAVMWVGDDSAVVAIERHPTAWSAILGDGVDTAVMPLFVEELTGPVLAMSVPIARLPMLWLRWAGFLEGADGAAACIDDPTVIDHRVRDATVPLPPQAGDLAVMWRAGWREWSIRDEATDTRLRYVRVPGHGVYAERPCRGGVEFAPRPSGLVWGDLVRLYCGLAPVRLAAGNDADW